VNCGGSDINAKRQDEILDAIRKAFISVRDKYSDIRNESKRKSRQCRLSRAIIEQTIQNLNALHWVGSSSIAVFGKRCDLSNGQYYGGNDNKPDRPIKNFNIEQELLYDIHMVEYTNIPHIDQSEIKIVKPILQLESEFEHSTKAIITDFNKLVCGSAAMKIMLLPRVGGNVQTFLKCIKSVADNIAGHLFIGILPYPEKWNQKSEMHMLNREELSRLNATGWKNMAWETKL